MTCLIVDDDPVARALLGRFVERYDGLTLGGAFEDAVAATNALRVMDADLLFLDVEMPEMTGLEMAEALGDDGPQVILVTSKAEYARDAFEIEATDYLVKPPTYARFHKAVERARRRADAFATPASEPAASEPECAGAGLAPTDSLFVKVDGRLVKLDLGVLDWVEAQKDYVLFRAAGAEHLVYATMKAVEARLPGEAFARVHRSYLVRVGAIEDLEDGSLVVGDKVIPVGASYRARLMERLNTL